MKSLRNIAILCLTTLTVVLAGAAPAIADDGLTPSSPALEFSSTEVHGSYQQQSVSFLNGSEAAVNVKAVEITGSDAGDFSVAGNGCGNVEPTFACEVSVQFQPQTPGAKSATLVLTDSSGTVEVALSGTGAEGPRLSVNPQQALLGNVAVGSSLEQTFTVSNTGDYPLAVQGGFVVSGTPLMFPIVDETCSRHYIEPGDSCTITVAFRPTVVGQKDASIILITNSQAGVSAVGLEGTGVPSGDSSPANVTAPIAETPAGPSPALIAPPSSVSPVVAPDLHPRLISLARHRSRFTVNTGIGALCPAGVALCRVRTVLTTTLALRRARGSHSAGVRTPVLLGSTVATLHGGQRAAVRGELSHSGLALLEHRRHLKVAVMVAITVPGVPTVMQWRTLTLTARVAPIVVG